jgi:membrane-associated PAP2 superfamily phosphatase
MAETTRGPHDLRICRDTLWFVGLCFLGMLLLATLHDVDVALSRHFYDPTVTPAWRWKYTVPWRWLYQYGEWPSWLLALGAAGVWLGSRWRCSWGRYRHACALLVLAVTLGPGLLVNGVVKSLWGRPRPYQSDVFGGSRPYRHWWQPGSIGGGRSLPSGHAAMGYILVVGTYLVPLSQPAWRRRLVLGLALTYGSLLGITRLIQGGHFLSDVLWSGALMCFTAATLHAVFCARIRLEGASCPHLRQASAVDTMGLP